MKLTLPAAKRWSIGWEGYPGHRGLDFGWGDGDQVLAAAPGTVVEVYGGGGYNGGFGNRIVVQHASGVYTTYNHLATGTVLVRTGQPVRRGQQLATMGSTGRSTAKHLHFELELGGRGPAYRVDPAPYFSRDIPGTPSDPATSPVDPATVPEEEDEPMKAVYYQEGKSYYVLVFHPVSGFTHEYNTTDASYNGIIATTFGTGSFAKVTKGHYNKLKADLAKVLKEG